MSAKDQATLDFYAREAEDYASRARTAKMDELGPFLALVPPGGRILELGCGGGQDSEAMLAAGFDVTPTDGSPELAREAEKRLGRPVGVLLFEDIADESAFDGVWANACLLHVSRTALPSILVKIHAALKPGGAFYASFKAGEEEGHDSLGRFYNYPDTAWLRQAFGRNWDTLDITAEVGGGYDNLPTDWLHVVAVKGT